MEAPTDVQPFPRESMPIVDLAPWFRDDKSKPAVGKQVWQACTETGFFYITNHGIPAATIQGIFQAARDFFSLDEDAKVRVHYKQTNCLRGYIPLRGEGKEHGGDLKEAYDCAPEYLPPPTSAGAAERASVSYWEHKYARNPWPEGLNGFREAVEAYLAALMALGRVLFAVFAAGFELPLDYFSPHLDQPIAEVRLLRYPPQDPQSNQAAIGIKTHCDAECFTILAQGQSGGIQVKKRSGVWGLAPSIDGAFLVLIGEMLARWTNDIFLATPHRVIHLEQKERYSFPFFFGPNFDTPLACLDPCQSPERPARYSPVIAGDWFIRRIAGDDMDQPRVL